MHLFKIGAFLFRVSSINLYAAKLCIGLYRICSFEQKSISHMTKRYRKWRMYADNNGVCVGGDTECPLVVVTGPSSIVSSSSMSKKRISDCDQQHSTRLSNHGNDGHLDVTSSSRDGGDAEPGALSDGELEKSSSRRNLRSRFTVHAKVYTTALSTE